MLKALVFQLLERAVLSTRWFQISTSTPITGLQAESLRENGEAVQVETHQLDPALKALGFNSLKAHTPFKPLISNCQPATPSEWLRVADGHRRERRPPRQGARDRPLPRPPEG